MLTPQYNHKQLTGIKRTIVSKHNNSKSTGNDYHRARESSKTEGSHPAGGRQNNPKKTGPPQNCIDENTATTICSIPQRVNKSLPTSSRQADIKNNEENTNSKIT